MFLWFSASHPAAPTQSADAEPEGGVPLPQRNVPAPAPPPAPAAAVPPADGTAQAAAPVAAPVAGPATASDAKAAKSAPESPR
jgi:hypothetical protein